MKEPHDHRLETPHQLGERFQRELREMVETGAITPAVAERILDDLFEPAAPGEPRPIRLSVWRTYVEDEGRSSEAN